MIILPRIITRPYNWFNKLKHKPVKSLEPVILSADYQLVIPFVYTDDPIHHSTSHPEHDGGDGFIYVKSRIVKGAFITRYSKETGKIDREYTDKLLYSLKI